MKRVFFACWAAILMPASAAMAQAAAPKAVTRAEFVRNLDQRFNTADTNHDGKVTRDEVLAQQKRDLDQGKARLAQTLQAKFKQLDTNRDGQLSLQEFMAAAPPIRTAETPEQMIQHYDTNHDGVVSADEFRAPELAKFNRVDTNHDGIVTPAEVKAAAGMK